MALALALGVEVGDPDAVPYGSMLGFGVAVVEGHLPSGCFATRGAQCQMLFMQPGVFHLQSESPNVLKSKVHGLDDFRILRLDDMAINQFLY